MRREEGGGKKDEPSPKAESGLNRKGFLSSIFFSFFAAFHRRPCSVFLPTIHVPSPGPTVAMKHPRLLTSRRKQANLSSRQGGRSGRGGQQSAGQT